MDILIIIALISYFVYYYSSKEYIMRNPKLLILATLNVLLYIGLAVIFLNNKLKVEDCIYLLIPLILVSAYLNLQILKKSFEKDRVKTIAMLTLNLAFIVFVFLNIY